MARRLTNHPVYRCMKESNWPHRRGAARVKNRRTHSPLSRVRSGTFGHDSPTSRHGGYGDGRPIDVPRGDSSVDGASCKLSRAVQPAVSRQSWYCRDKYFALEETSRERRKKKNIYISYMRTSLRLACSCTEDCPSR